MSGINVISMKSCRICLSSSRTLCPLFKYQYSGNYAEMLTGIADVKVSHNDDLPDKICAKCCTALEKAYLLKTLAESSDRKLRTFLKKLRDKAPTKKISFNSFNDVKTEIAPLVKSEPKWEMEIEVLNSAVTPPVETTEGKDIVIANTVIKKVDPNKPEIKPDLETDNAEVTWTSNKGDPEVEEYLDDEIFQDDVNDEDYVPPMETKKSGFKKPKLSDIKVFKDKTVVRKIKVLRKIREDGGEGRSTMITCYPIMKNGARGAPILLKRPKDATVLKVHSNYKSKDPSYVSRESKSLEGTRVVRREKAARVLTRRIPKPISKQKEKLVCPVCGILTFTLGNHMTTHQEKKRYSCPDCTRTFAQKGNLQVHQKQHTGIKDHICEICGAGFYSQKSLVRHNLIHKGERPYPCNLCNKKFIARCDLNRHLRIHSGYKPYKCATCAMSFNAKHQLQNHERMHTGERPYTCQVCNVAFSYKVNLNNHVFKVHGVNLKFKSIHTVTEDVLRTELGLANEARVAISHIIGEMAQTDDAENETVTHHEF